MPLKPWPLFYWPERGWYEAPVHRFRCCHIDHPIEPAEPVFTNGNPGHVVCKNHAKKEEPCPV